ncbi:MAG: hypothetical protein RIC03_12255 [Cyclobacteriaceae bacterium]
MKSLTLKIGLSLALIMTITLPLLAQGAPPATPIDGGLSLLLLAGGAYGVKKLYSKRK